MAPRQIDSRLGQPIQHRECGAHSAGIENPRSAGLKVLDMDRLPFAPTAPLKDSAIASRFSPPKTLANILATMGLPRQWNQYERSLSVSRYQQMARPASRAAAALFPADPERRQGLDHARRDRPALRAASRQL